MKTPTVASVLKHAKKHGIFFRDILRTTNDGWIEMLVSDTASGGRVFTGIKLVAGGKSGADHYLSQQASKHYW